MPKLCYICEATQGGVRKHLCQLIRTFSRRQGYALQAILGDRGESGLQAELAELASQGSFEYVFVSELQREIRPGCDLTAYREIRKRVKALQPDIVHTHSSKAGFLGRRAAQSVGVKKIIHTPHVFPFQWTEGVVQRVYLGLEWFAARQCHTIVCVGDSQRQDALARGVADAQKLVTIRNGVELPVPISPERRRQLRRGLGLGEKTPAVGMVARLAPQKGVGMFVRAAAQMLRLRPDIVMLLVGEGPLESEVRERAAEAKLPPESFRLLGYRPDAESLYPAFDVLVLSSLYEGLPYVLLEAMAYGVPVVATDVLGSRDVIVDGTAGFLANSSDPGDIARKTLRLINDPALHALHSAAVRQRVEQEFSFEQFVEGHRALYESD